MPKVDLLTLEGEKKGKFDLPKEIFAAKIKPVLVVQAVRVYLANQRRAKAKVKSRGEVRGSRRKIWRQKGTGRARHGDRYAPIFVGGGVAHGPTGQENYSLKLTRKMKRQALFSALTSKFKAGEIFVVKDLDKIKPKTKEIAGVLNKISVGKSKTMLVLPGVLENVIRAAKNLSGVQLAQASLLNPYQVLNGGQLVFMPDGIRVLEKTFLGKKEKSKKPVARKGKKEKKDGP